MNMTNDTLKNLTSPGRYTDNKTKGLHLWIKDPVHMYWILRYTVDGKRPNMSLGAFPEVSLAEARKKAIEARSAVNKGIDPIQAKKQAKTQKTASNAPTFEHFSLEYIGTMRPKWRNEKHADQWVSTVKTYAFPVIGDFHLEEIDTTQILQILQPIWLKKPETAARLRGRIERILSAAITLRLRPAGNPAIWRGHLENLLPSQRASNKHHEALPYDQLPAFMNKLRELDALSALALEFTILNAARTGEVLKGLKSEIVDSLWTIPAERMKAGKLHQIPLTQRSLDILTVARSMDPDSPYMFSRKGKPLSSMSMLMLVRRLQPGLTVHGFRSTFRDWIAEETDHSPEVAEMALAHTIGNKVERAYRRGNLMEPRRRLMKDWSSFCMTGNWGNVIQMTQRKIS